MRLATKISLPTSNLLKMLKQTKGALPQTATRAYEKICEEYTLENAILEAAQNAFEHGNAPLFSTKCWCDDEGINHISFFNNGRPMDEKTLRKFSTEYHCHDISHSTPDSNGNYTSLKGYGLKDLCVFCSSEEGISTVSFRSYLENGILLEWNWKICKRNGDRGSFDECVAKFDYDVTSHPSGFEIHIANAKKFTETNLITAQRKVAKSFTHEFSKNRTIQIKWKDKQTETVKLYDPMHFELMPLSKNETIYNCPCGYYVGDDIIWFVSDDKFRGIHPETKEITEISIRTISAYINEPTYKKKYPKTVHKDSISTNEAGIYPLMGESYLETGDNKAKHFGLVNNVGGACRYRIAPLITKENAFLWGIKSIKNNGVTSFANNALMTEDFHKINDDGSNGESIFDYLYEKYSFLHRFHENVIRVKTGEYDYYKNNGFFNKEKIKNDIDGFINKVAVKSGSPVEKEFRPVIEAPSNAVDVLYTINKKSAIIKRELDENSTWVHSLNTAVLGTSFNEANKADILYSVFDTLQELGAAPIVFQTLAERLPSKIHHYE